MGGCKKLVIQGTDKHNKRKQRLIKANMQIELSLNPIFNNKIFISRTW